MVNNSKYENDIQDSWLVGKIDMCYSTLVELFGEPDCFDNYKTDAEWVVKFGDNVFCIYNYKTGKNYLKEYGEETENLTHWHIGGNVSPNEFIEALKEKIR